MELKDFIVTPIFFILILGFAYFARLQMANVQTSKYFYPALVIRLVAAILLGCLYQFYYDGGDTFLYHTRGSVVVYETLLEDPIEGINLFFTNGNPTEHKYSTISRIRYFGDASSFKIVQIATIFDLFTFGTYSATALFFALLSFSGCWALFKVFYSYFPALHKQLALIFLFIPSVIFWGSGLLKDSITLMAFGWLVFCFDKIFLKRSWTIFSIVLLFLSIYLLYKIKLYILLALLPSLIIWYFITNIKSIRNAVLRWMTTPIILVVCIAMGYFFIDSITQENEKYSIDQISNTAMVTAHDIAYWTGKDAGSTYVLGELDGSFESLIRLLPEALNVTYFRPYPWEINNILMLLSSIESSVILVFFIYLIIRSRVVLLFDIQIPPIIFFAIVFSLVFGFAVGASTFNFGTLSRYKIPCMPMFLMVLIYFNHELKIKLKSIRDLEHIS